MRPLAASFFGPGSTPAGHTTNGYDLHKAAVDIGSNDVYVTMAHTQALNSGGKAARNRLDARRWHRYAAPRRQSPVGPRTWGLGPGNHTATRTLAECEGASHQSDMLERLGREAAHGSRIRASCLADNDNTGLRELTECCR